MYWCPKEEFGPMFLTSWLILILWVQLGNKKILITPGLLKIDQSMKTLGLHPLLALNNTYFGGWLVLLKHMTQMLRHLLPVDCRAVRELWTFNPSGLSEGTFHSISEGCRTKAILETKKNISVINNGVKCWLGITAFIY